ncbi:MAG: thiamine phosphate synthase [Planctomycetota bacterium]|nr:MAG: thiamine phosphate synthase [Planctomycetota bacterium]
MRLPPPLIAVTPGTSAAGGLAALRARLCALVELDGVGVLLREPALGEAAQFELLRELRARAPRAWLCAHARPALALAAAADAVQLSFRSLLPRELAGWIRARVALGLSAHAHDAAERWDGADYLIVGPVRDTPSKRGLVEPLGDAGLAREVARAAGRPVWAIGGLGAGDVAAVRASGARGLALRGALFDAPDPVAAARAVLAELSA